VDAHRLADAQCLADVLVGECGAPCSDFVDAVVALECTALELQAERRTSWNGAQAGIAHRLEWRSSCASVRISHSQSLLRNMVPLGVFAALHALQEHPRWSTWGT
jgi:hypothetical protein